ncbi:MAG: sulfatase-like hydrolase/transferase [Pseudomonadota bacterium]
MDSHPSARIRFFSFYLLLSLLLLAALLARLVAPLQGGLSMEPHVARLVGGVLASPGFWADAAHFALGLVAVHIAFAAALWLASAGWLAALDAPRRTLRLVQVLLLALAMLAVFILNARWYPLVPSSFLRRAPGLVEGPVLLAIGGLFAASLLASLACWARRQRLLAPAAVGLGLAAVAGLGLWTPPATGGGGVGSRDPAKPNILLIGVDSLRPDETGFVNGQSRLTPHIDAFLREARLFDTAYTPLGRTFGGWMAALTGREPVNSGARENLIGNDQVTRDATLGHWLKALGYRSVLAMDERHFSSVDESFGFDAVVGPKHGVLDLLISYFDHPLVNLVSHRPLAEHLFPYLYLNRGRPYNYDPRAYTDAVLAELAAGGERPLFLALHFLLPHYPYVSNAVEELDDMEFHPVGDRRYHYFYRMLLRQADRQFGDLMAGLEEQGLLDNTLVVLLSDHGDSFQLERDAARPGTDSAIEVETNTRGHGTNVLSQGQYRVMLALRGYGLRGEGAGRVAALPARNPQTVSLIDIAPTVADLLAGTGALAEPWPGMDGHSLLGPIPPQRGIYLESALTSMALMQSDIDEQQLLSETARYYMVNPAGKVVMRPDLIDATIATKLRAVVREHWLLSMSPVLRDELILLDTQEMVWWPATKAPAEAPWQDMLGDMCRHYDGDPGFDHYGLCGRLLAGAQGG